MPTNRFGTIIFDFDYTLADSSRGVIDCVNFALDELGLDPSTEDRIKPTIGLSLYKTFETLTGNQDKALSEEFLRLFISHADEVMADSTVLFDFVPAVMETLKSHDTRLGIVTSKYRYRIEEILERENLNKHFDVIVGGNDVPELKPHPQGLLMAVETLSSTPNNSLYVGDSVTDAETSNRANVPFAAVLSGVTHRSRFDDYDVLHILEDVSELLILMSR